MSFVQVIFKLDLDENNEPKYEGKIYTKGHGYDNGKEVPKDLLNVLDVSESTRYKRINAYLSVEQKNNIIPIVREAIQEKIRVQMEELRILQEALKTIPEFEIDPE
ncbi:hypothetical protein ACFVS2_25895 [Brevibacillus sp. NPDC058079]|uniref:hypothetical protein n=1 Tax=Brevibacillus sp. NPDC058079 TaxID=3346330 RepID=UPI0036E01235